MTSLCDIFTTSKLKYTLTEQIEYYRSGNLTITEYAEEFPKEKEGIIDLDKFFDILEAQFINIKENLKTESFFDYAKTADEITSFANHLIGCIKKISPEEEILLFYFLQTAICYSVKFTKKEECNLEQLVFLAILLRDDTTKEYVRDTLFDIIIKGDLIKNSGDNSLLGLTLYYERFCKNKTENASEIIYKNLIKIAKNYKPYPKK